MVILIDNCLMLCITESLFIGVEGRSKYQGIWRIYFLSCTD